MEPDGALPYDNDNVTFVPVALQVLDELAGLDAAPPAADPETAEPTTDLPATTNTVPDIPEAKLGWGDDPILARSAALIHVMGTQQVMTAAYVGREATDVDDQLTRGFETVQLHLDAFAAEIDLLPEPERAAWHEAALLLSTANDDLMAVVADNPVGDAAGAADRKRALREVAVLPEEFTVEALDLFEPDLEVTQAFGWLAALNESAAHLAVVTEVAYSSDQRFDTEDWAAYLETADSAEQLRSLWYESASPELRQRYEQIPAGPVDAFAEQASQSGMDVAAEVWLAAALNRLGVYQELTLTMLSDAD
jgi:hypothetical protein